MLFESSTLGALLKMGSHNTKALDREEPTKIPYDKNVVKFIYQEHEEIINRKVVEGELCFDHNRVVLSEETGSSNYINASYIDGFEHSKAYITTETPDSEKKICDFWKMIWEHQTEIIVMLNEPDGYEKGVFYWSLEERSTLYCGKLNIETLNSQRLYPGLEITKLIVTHEDGGSLIVNHFLYKNWQRVDILPSERDFLDLINTIRLYNRFGGILESVKGYRSPIVIHCSDGLERSMAFCVIDVSISQILKTGKVNLSSIVSRLSRERFNCLHCADHYCFCYSVFYHYFTFFM
uniref:Protein tyrosine phosphatase n=1 Tax=Glyptapanteles flavicoxis TaxID=463051 RepID=B7S8E2_9HYME|nr:protein tyrosine phosphatase [Glyptapanteles flavicoxis]